MVREGPEFNNALPGVVEDYLNSTGRISLEVNPSRLKISTDGRILFLQVFNGSIKEYPLRRAFLYKLLKWYNFPAGQLYKLSTETITSVCNDYLMNIKRDYVTLKLEGEDALTILSPGYNEITDLDIIKSCSDIGISRISRNDYFLSITTEDKMKTEPVPGDECGIGLNIVNSETGFRALAVSHYILRYICSNGAVARDMSGNNRRYHYGREDLKSFLNCEIKKMEEQRKEIGQKLKALNQRKAQTVIDMLMKKLRDNLGKAETKNILSAITDRSTQYQLFNLITSAAKHYGLSRRHSLESLAGEMLMN